MEFRLSQSTPKSIVALKHCDNPSNKILFITFLSLAFITEITILKLFLHECYLVMEDKFDII